MPGGIGRRPAEAVSWATGGPGVPLGTRRSAWSGIQTVVQGVWSVIKRIISAIASGVHAITGAAHTLANVWGSGGGALSTSQSYGKYKPHKFGTGGIVTSPTLGIVGAEGIEIVLDPAQFRRALGRRRGRRLLRRRDGGRRGRGRWPDSDQPPDQRPDVRPRHGQRLPCSAPPKEPNRHQPRAGLRENGRMKRKIFEAAHAWAQALAAPIEGPDRRLDKAFRHGNNDAGRAAVDELAVAIRDQIAWAKANPCPDPTLGRLGDELLEANRERCEILLRAAAGEIPPAEQDAAMARAAELQAVTRRYEKRVRRWIGTEGRFI